MGGMQSEERRISAGAALSPRGKSTYISCGPSGFCIESVLGQGNLSYKRQGGCVAGAAGRKVSRGQAESTDPFGK